MRTPTLSALLASAALVVTTGAVAAPALATAPASPAVSAAASDPLLRQGMRGAAVRDWQRVLDRAVVAGVVEATRVRADGVFGPRTRAVTLALQARAGLVQDGVVGPLTRDAVAGLLDGGAPSTPAPEGDRLLRAGLRGQDVRDWQRAVNRAVQTGHVEHRRLVEDGVFGPGTRAATVAVQRALGITPDGVVGPLTREGLAGLLG